MYLKQIALVFIFIVISCKQNDRVDFKNKETYSKVEKTLSDSIIYYLYTKPDKAIPYLNKYLKLSINNKESVKTLMIYSSLGIAYDIKGDLAKSLYFHSKSLDLCEENNRCIISAKYTIGKLYERRYKYKQALKFYKECYAIAEKKNLLKEYEKIEYDLALINSKIGFPEGAIKLLSEKYEKIRKIGEPKRVRILRRDLIGVYLDAGKLDNVFKLIDIALKDAKEVRNKEIQFYLYKYESEAYIKKGDLKRANKSISNASLIAKSIGKEQFIIESNYLLALIKKKQGKSLVSIEVLERDLKRKHKISKILCDSYKLLATCYEGLNNNEKSSFYYKKLNEEEERVKNEDLSILNETRLLSIEELKKQESKAKTNSWYWSIAFITSLIVSIYIFYRNKSNKKENQELFEILMLRIKNHEENKVKLEEALKQKDLNTIKSKLEERPENDSNVQEEFIYSIDEEKVNEILLKLKKLESQKYFLRQDCTLHNMAKKLKTNTSYLSKIVNTHLNKTFSTYINELRINYVIIELKHNKQLRAYSTKAIAQELGYKKAASFTKYFKEATGITPVVYIKKIKELI